MASLIFILVLLCTNILIADAKNNSHIIRDSVTVYFRQGYATFDPTYSSNGTQLDMLVHNINQSLKRNVKNHHINIIAGASPEGDSYRNLILSEKRAMSVARYLMTKTDIPEDQYSIKGIGVNWGLLTDLINVSDIKNRNEILHMMEQTQKLIIQKGKPIDKSHDELNSLYGRETYQWLFNQTRSASIIVEYIHTNDLPSPDFEHNIPIGYLYCEPQIPQPVPQRKKRYYVALKTNLLYDAGLIPNIGGEIYLGRQWSVSGYYKHAWWKSDTHHWYWRTYGGELSFRKWLGKKAKEKPLTGHHLGLYGETFTYDFEMGGKGVMADKWSYTFGAEYGYSLPIARHLNIDFVIGLGYMGGEYREYTPTDMCYAWTATKKRHWVGPTKVEIALVWLIGHNNYNKRKGGEL